MKSPALRYGGEGIGGDGNGDSEGLKQKLIDEFGDILEVSLIIVIAGDRDIQKEYEKIREILIPLADSARAEQATNFDPSGLGSWAEIEGLASEVGTSGNGISTENATTISDYSDTEAPKFTHQADLGDADKVESLELIFPNFKEHTIKFILKNSNGDLERAFDELLDRQFLHESGDLPKGIDGFCVPDHGSQSPQGKTKSSRSRTNSRKNKLSLSYTVVSPTINDAELEDAPGPSQLPKTMYRPASSRMATSEPSPFTEPYDWQVIPKRAVPPRAITAPATPDLEASRSHLRAAAVLNRLGPLGRQGNVVYIERAREAARVSLAKAAIMAERLVNQQSTASKIDLHGVTVLDGVRIAKHRVWQWWGNLGEGREQTAKEGGFTVITGVGHHSAGGVSRLRQAVGAALKNDGWRVEPLTGQFYVTGRL
ncbi:hypothetical protein B0T25DRAFT_547673 [Lasiosphaeria hispida]|uniref:Smr domain-containing protein n=1 Tax=Lasiosphaeria hispida TaxID=260671 RepID=A0AAJ0HED4_9PEZI|nr:hypothetical protein B0T25DRAFT_547673 [Lasiosphaeria hispida]